MAWFKKKKEQETQEEIPKLPGLPEPVKFSLPTLPEPISNETQKDLPELPTLPELKTETNFNPNIIKQEIMAPKKEMQKSQFNNINPSSIKTSNQPTYHQPPNYPQQIKSQKAITSLKINPPKSRIKEAEPIYVRLDKFEASLESFEEIKRKITEIEEILRKTKEVKQKEEQELEEWEREIQIIKSRITAIDKTIFNKLD